MGCNCSMGTIERNCDKNAPGLKVQIYAACQDEILAIPDPDAGTHVVSGDITYRAADAVAVPPVEAGKFALWNISSRDQDFNTEQDENGMWNTTVQMFIPKLEAAKSYILNDLGEDNSIFIVPDKNGKKRIVGSVEEPANVRVREQTTPTNGYIVTVNWQSGSSPYFYEGAITT